MAIVFIVVATLDIVIRYAVAGVPIGTGIGLACCSSPIVFFACFMLDEPLTLPPRRWQQLTEAVVVALLFQRRLLVGPSQLHARVRARWSATCSPSSGGSAAASGSTS